MATTQRQSILDAIYTKLAAISGVATVYRGLRDWDAVGTSEMPWVGYWPGPDRAEYYGGQGVRLAMPVIVLVHVSASTQSAKTQVLSDWHDDILAALSTDQTLAGTATMVTLTESETDEGDDAIDSRGGSGTLVMNFDIVYHRTTAAV